MGTASMVDIPFGCTMCGKCCHNHSLPLTIDEAILWLEDGGSLCVLCEAVTGPTPPAPDDAAQLAQVAYRMRRAFAARSGGEAIHVIATLVGIIRGACRHLGADMRCRIYERRPLVCRIYPAEVNPFYEFDTGRKACPPEAWTQGGTLIAGGEPVDPATRALITEARRRDAEDAPRKRRICRALGIDVAAIAGEGFAVHPRDTLSALAALRGARNVAADDGTDDANWRLYSPRAETAAMLRTAGFDAVSHKRTDDGFWYDAAAARPKLREYQGH
jgi:Fe-S-cluster containining protein